MAERLEQPLVGELMSLAIRSVVGCAAVDSGRPHVALGKNYAQPRDPTGSHRGQLLPGPRCLPSPSIGHRTPFGDSPL